MSDGFERMGDGDTAAHGWAGSFGSLRDTATLEIETRLRAFVPGASPEQEAAWHDSVPRLQREVAELIERDRRTARHGAVLEYQLPLNHRRPDVLLLMGGSVLVLEAKSASVATQAALDQVAAYARDLRAYHESCADRPVHPVLMLTRASGDVGTVRGVRVVGPDAIDAVAAELDEPARGEVPVAEFLDPRRYRPLPSLVRAARELFEHGELRRVKRPTQATRAAFASVTAVTREAARTNTRHLVLLTGAPGTGKTLVGLQLVHARFLDSLGLRSSEDDPVSAVFLSGNGPLVQVLQYELARAGQGGGGRTFVRDVKSYVERYVKSPALAPAERVVVFDEAQRAWDAEKMAREHASVASGSEPDHLIEFADRIPGWCLVVGLIGSGQEIHDGEEGGLGQWRRALDRSAAKESWIVSAAPDAAQAFVGWRDLRIDGALRLEVELRYHAADDVHGFVDSLLTPQPVEALAPAVEKLEREGYHLRMTRDLDGARRYLRARYADNPEARFGIVASARDRDLERFGVPNGYQATKLVRYGPWYAEGDDDDRGRSCRALRECVTEFGCQGLELDGALVAWGTDLVLDGGRWTNRYARRYQRPDVIHDAMALRRNAYRVLLTRGRDGMVVYVPPMPLLDPVYDLLRGAGLVEATA